MKLPRSSSVAWLCLGAAILNSISLAAPTVKVGDFALLDHEGKFHQLSWYGDQHAVVIFTQANGVPVVRDSVPALVRLRDEFAERGIVFFMLNSTIADSRDRIAEETRNTGHDIPILVDEAQLVAKSLGVERAGEVLVIAPATRTLLFRGPLDDARRNGLRNVLEAVLSGQAVAPDSADLIGLPARADAPTTVSYTRDIAPILKDHCVSCHHDGGIGPWAMSSHAMVQGWSAMIREVVMTRRMPPGQIDEHASQPIANAAGLSPQEQRKLVAWIDGGAPFDGGEDPLTVMSFVDAKFSLGVPDMVFKVPAQTIPATGLVDYRYVPVELNLDRDVWVRAMEFVPGDRKVLHHVIAYLSSPADKTVRGRATGAARGESVGGFAPGRQPDAFADNSGRLITKGSNLLLQMHYTTSGKETVDETEVGLFVYDEPPAYVMSGGVAGQRRFLVPAHAKDYKLEGEQLIERDAYLYGMTPHMHFRGKYMSYTVVYPDGASELVLSVPKYDFNWQFSYELAQPLFLPAGTRLVAKGAMDNSAQNPGNPDPTQPVYFGLQTKHEMFFGFTTLRYVGDTPRSVGGDKNAEDTVARR